MLSDVLMWNKIGRVVTRISERKGISASRAFELFYTSQLCKDLHVSYGRRIPSPGNITPSSSSKT